MIGIYAIENTVTGECYVGQSKNIEARFQQHMAMLAKGEHHSIKLQKAYDSMGIGAFAFKILEICDVDSLDAKEQKWIDKLDAYDKGYNMRLQSCEDNKDMHERICNALYHQFKNYCYNLGLTVTEAINVIIDMEIKTHQNNIYLLQSLKGTLEGTNTFKEIAKENDIKVESKNVLVDLNALMAAALDIKREVGRVGRHSLMKRTGCSEHYAKLALAELKNRHLD
ncbi:GIY-YIG nuclease family protein [Thermoactinomyces daqus]|uniref:GIY-YIG nuclease family protein n=1 Tax=Thermoactinomyces daqus TaxID=1329516 RepID=A0A7W1XAD3_9BACL|nr:GIY-YIG nuclease family protein [Thermoactinomyces daqus]MBA4542918.1 GIY-YIG nuclease family protein [Thermoactinomyces daqus]